MDRSAGDELLAAKRPRRCVQSKLSFAPRPNESACAAAPPPAVETEDGGSDSEEREKECKRRRNKKIKPQRRDIEESADNNKEAKESRGCRKKSTRGEKNKQYGDKTLRKNTTPIKFDHHGPTSMRTLNGKLGNSIDCNDENVKIEQPSCDLWSEAKKTAEENLRLSDGKQTHPFFSICRVTKVLSADKCVEKSENINWFAHDGDYCVSLPPVHVFETVKDELAVPDWKNWKFLETQPSKLDCHSSMEVSSVFEGSIKPLKFEADCEKMSVFDHLLYNDRMNSAHGATSSDNLLNGLASKEQPLSHFKLEQVHAGFNFSQPSAHDSIEDAQNEDKLHKGRLASYGQRSIGCPDCSLWTDKYRPGISMEVCGNTESVMLLSDWLKSWQERGGQSSLKENRSNCSPIEDSEDSSYDIDSDMEDLYCEETLKNVLLITGPVGSGKSAAIYACAREQGFKVIEVNASSLRNGAYMRQTFGEGVDSLGLTHWLAEDPTHQISEHAQQMQLSIPIVAENGLEAYSVEMSSKICDRDNTTETSLHGQIANKSLFLFEEVDVVFDEDHGFISTILKLAETTRRPIILTSNSKRPVLPQLMDHLVLDFKAPSYPELLCHTSMVCAFEKINISCNLLEQIVEACLGDTRRVLMLLQFWCQGMGDITDKKIPCTKDVLPFDIGAVHLAIPRVIPWDFWCELSEKIEEEMSKTISAVEDSFVKLISRHEINSREILEPSEKFTTRTVKSSKKGKLRRKHSLALTEFSDHGNNLEDLLCDSDSPSMCIQITAKPKRRVVLSSQSDDELSSDDLKPEDTVSNQAGLCSDELKPEDTLPQTNGYDLLHILTSPASKSPDIYGPLQIDRMGKSITNIAVQTSLDISEIASTSHVYDSSIMHDESCRPESSFITGIETNLSSSFVSKGLSQNSESASFDLSISPHILSHADMNSAYGAAVESSKPLENHVGAADVHIELLHGNQGIGCFQNEAEVYRSSHCQLMDECSQADFNAQSVVRDTSACPQEIASISETWRKLRRCENLKSLLFNSNSKDVAIVASLISGLTDLISDTDIMFRSCSPIVHDNLEPTSTPCVEPDSFSFYDELVEMGSTFAQHGLCFYTTKCAAAGSCLGSKITSNLAQEMLASSTNSTAIGKLLLQEIITGQSTSFNNIDAKAPQSKSTGRESVDDLYNDILPIVPTRLSMVLRGVAFHEYLSFIGQISRFECSRLAERLVEKQMGRSRTFRHYLSSGAHELSSAQAEGLARRTCFTRAATEVLSYYDSSKCNR